MPSSISVACDGTLLESNTSYFYTIEEGLNTAEVKIPAQYVQGSREEPGVPAVKIPKDL